MDNYFGALNSINVNDKTEKKNGLTYLSWAWAWGEVKKLHPDATFTIYEDSAGCFYHTDGRTAWVKTGVTVNGIEHIEYLPVMDFKNRSIPLESLTSVDVNKAIQRSLTKACARHGLGLYIYAGEDLPEDETGKTAAQYERSVEGKVDIAAIANQATANNGIYCDRCGRSIFDFKLSNGEWMPASEYAKKSKEVYGEALCKECATREKRLRAET